MPVSLRADFNARIVRAAAKGSKDGPQASPRRLSPVKERLTVSTEMAA
jgi:hypothetical protein